MPSVRDFFENEAADILRRLRAVVSALDSGRGDPAALRREARALRGSARMARDEDVARLAGGLDAVGRALADADVDWSAALAEALRATLADAERLVRRQADDPGAVADAALARLHACGVQLETDAPPARESRTGPAADFLAFAAREVDAIIAELDRVLLAANPRDHEPLAAVLRRQRPLMGAARLDSTPILGETLAALDEITRMVVRLGIAVKSEWLDVYRAAHDVLEAAAERLRDGEEPTRVPALSRLRTLRDELAQRYGVQEEPRNPPIYAPGEEPPAAWKKPGAGGREPGASPVAARQEPDAVPVEQFFYVGTRALRRAIELRAPLERAVAGDPRAREAMREVFDLIQLALA